MKQIFTDNFNRPDGAPGNSWVDRVGNIWQISSNHLIATGAPNQRTDWCGRPQAEAVSHQRIVARAIFNNYYYSVCPRVKPGAAAVYRALFDSFGNCSIHRSVDGGTTSIGAIVNNPGGWVIGREYEHTIDIQDNIDGSQTITHSVKDLTTSTVYGPASVTDTYGDLHGPLPGGVLSSAPPAGGAFTAFSSFNLSEIVSGGDPYFASSIPGQIVVQSPAPTGGSGTITYQWHRSTAPGFTPDGSTVLTGQTALVCTDETPLPHVNYYYRLVATDGQDTLISDQVPARIWEAPLRLGFIGSSTYNQTGTLGYTIPDRVGQWLGIINGNRQVSVTNAAVDGSDTSQWLPASTNLTNAKTAFAAAGVTHVVMMLGANDVYYRDASAWQANASAIAADLVAAGYIVIFTSIAYRGTNAPFPDGVAENRAEWIDQYNAAARAIANGKSVRFADWRNWEILMTRYRSAYGDCTHPNQSGIDIEGFLQAAGIARCLGWSLGPWRLDSGALIWSGT